MDTNPKIGFNVGLTADYNFTSSLFLTTGIDLTTKGAKWKFELDIDDMYIEEGEETSFNVTINPIFLQMPLHIGYKFDITQNTKIFFHAGGYAAVGVAGKMSMGGVSFDIWGKESLIDKNDFQRFDYGLGGGFGVEFGKINVGLAYEHGFANINTDVDRDIFHRNATLTVGYKF